ncbi:hypothetical protein BZH17_26785, partial [Salmonella enterica]|nr:hypothetical protein [Salmonella enterica]
MKRKTSADTRTSKTSLTATEAYQKAMAAKYVKVRERYVYPSCYNFARCLAKHHGDNIEDIKPGLSVTLESGF